MSLRRARLRAWPARAALSVLDRLRDVLADQQLLSPEDLAALRAELEQALAHGPLPRRKAILQLLIEEITVESRAAIQPTFRVPAVRVMPQTMEAAEQKSNRSARLPGGPLSI